MWLSELFITSHQFASLSFWVPLSVYILVTHPSFFFSYVNVFIPFLPKLSFFLILSLSARIFLCPSSPALESESSPLPSAHLPRHFRPGMASRSTTPPPLHVSQSDTAMLRKSVSFSEELLLAASGRTHPLLSQWPLTLGAVIASSVTTPQPLCCPLAEYHARLCINCTNKWIFPHLPTYVFRQMHCAYNRAVWFNVFWALWFNKTPLACFFSLTAS